MRSWSSLRIPGTMPLCASTSSPIARAPVASLTSALHDLAQRPLLLASDFERGPGQQVKGLTELPPPGALGFLNDLDATYACGQITGVEARAVGLTWVFAPVCDLDVE